MDEREVLLEGLRALEPAVDDETVAGCLAAWREAIAALPDLPITLDRVVPLARDRLAKAPRGLASAPGLDWHELAIAAGCHEGLFAAIERLERDYVSVARPALRGMGLDSSTIEDVLQWVRKKLLVAEDAARPRICGYAGDGRLAGLVRVMAVREGLVRIRKQNRECPGDVERLFERHGEALDPELAGIEREHREALKEAFEIAVTELTSRQRNLLRMQSLDGVSVEQIAQLYQVHRVTASRWLRDARQAVAEGTRRHLRRTLALDTREMASLIRVVQSQVEMSLERIFATRSPTFEDDRGEHPTELPE